MINIFTDSARNIIYKSTVTNVIVQNFEVISNKSNIDRIST